MNNKMETICKLVEEGINEKLHALDEEMKHDKICQTLLQEGFSVSCEEYRKVNIITRSVVIAIGDSESGDVAKVAYDINSIFEGNPDFTDKDFADFIVESFFVTDPKPLNVLGDMQDKIKLEPKRVVMQVINAELNEEFLKTVPHRTFLDLAVIYRCVLDSPADGLNTSYVVRDEIMEHAGLTEEELHAFAMENTKRIIEPSYTSGFMNFTGILLTEMPGCAASMFCFPEYLQEIAEREDTEEYYILPSSLHEFIVMNDTVTPEITEAYRDTVEKVNKEVVEQRDFLSNSVYAYNVHTGLRIAE